MADKRDYYEILGVSKTATESEIKSAFRKKAKECHPDLHPGDKAKESQFKELNEAAEILSDADKRAKYDQYGHAAFDPSMGGQDPFAGGGFGGFGDFGDILGQMFGGGFGGFGGGQTRNGPIPGDDLRYNLTITFEEAAFGVEKEITIPREESCESCHGSGAKPGTEPVTCKTCNGTGQVRTQQSTILGSFTSTRPCTNCKGTGKVIADPCSDCRGSGRVRKNLKKAVELHPEFVNHYLELVNLKDSQHLFPRQLSGGMRKRVDVARALAIKPVVLLMDEPFAALDVLTKGKLQEEFLNIWNDNRMTVVFVTHDLEEA
ncbi:MAG: DnaJ domain-containing protein, partial [Alphaproteobacteria bacterium]|nr:DnaJ domain-containing protein [Alphaproteobacteria bacterium]